ncbi:MAG: hypothetical protein VCC01_09795, partial [Candidatus Hydrogenedentota bacterium]
MKYRILSLLICSLAVLPDAFGASLQIRRDESTQTLSVYRIREDKPILTQNIGRESRPNIHP